MNDLQELILRGMRDFFPAKDADILRAVGEGLQTGRLRVFLEGQSAFCIVAMPQTPLDQPQVLHFYSEKPGLRPALVSQVLDFIKKSGYTSLLAVNGSGLDDEIWKRLFHHDGWNLDKIKTVFEFKVKE